MTESLPPNLLALFAPRDPLPYLPPVASLPHEKETRGYLGVGAFLKQFEDPKDTSLPTRVETREERIERRQSERAEQVAYKLEQEISVWDPNSATNSTVDPFKTLFVARINYDTSESKLRREFEVYGPIKKIVLIHNSVNEKPRGYAFIEYEHEKDMYSAYKHADGKKIDGSRVVVDVERGRTVKGWLPRRLGGGLGGTRIGGPEVNIEHSGREESKPEKERYRLEREREERGGGAAAGGGGGGGRDRERERDRERDRGVGFENRRRSRSRERRRRSQSRSPRREKKRRNKERVREELDETFERRSREKDREKIERRRSKERVKREFDETFERRSPEKDRDRDCDRDRKRKRRRSKSRDKDRDRKRQRRERRERKRGERLEYIKTDDDGEVRIKEEPIDDYPEYPQYPAAETYDQTRVKYEEENEQKYEPNNTNGNRQYDD